MCLKSKTTLSDITNIMTSTKRHVWDINLLTSNSLELFFFLNAINKLFKGYFNSAQN